MLLQPAIPLIAALTLLTHPVAPTQVPKNNPVVTAVQQVGATGLKSGAKPATSAAVFKPVGREVYLETYFKELFPDKSERDIMLQVGREVVKGFEAEAKKLGIANDAAGAIGFSVLALHSVAYEGDHDETTSMAVIHAFQNALNTEAVRSASDEQKQAAYEWALGSLTTVIALAAAASDAESIGKVKQLAKAQIELITGAKPEAITIGKGSMTIKGTGVSTGNSEQPKPTTTSGSTVAPSGSGLAPGFSFTPPTGWTQDSGWHVGRIVEKGYETRHTNAYIRFLAPVAQDRNPGDLLRDLWKANMPDEIKDKVGGMVYRRYVGDQVPAHFVFGQGREKDRISDTLFSLYLVDCGKVYQPFILAQNYEEPGSSFTTGIEMSAKFSYPASADVAENFFKSFRHPESKGKALVDKAALAGNYHYGSGAGMDYVNVFTGATSFNFVSYGGTLFLKPDGTFSYTFSSASGAGGATTFRGAKGTGKWTLKGDIVETAFETYDQGDGYKVKSHTYRFAGLIAFPDGTRVAVLKSKLNQPVNAVTVTDTADYFSTKKKE